MVSKVTASYEVVSKCFQYVNSKKVEEKYFLEFYDIKKRNLCYYYLTL